MIGDMVVVDAVVNPNNLGSKNRNPVAKAQLEAVWGAPRMSLDPWNVVYTLTHEEFLGDFPYEVLAQAQFIGSPGSFGCTRP
jgi:hypothetical protein